VIEALNKDFVPVEVNLTNTPFPDLPALSNWYWAFKLIPNLKNGFVTSIVMDPTGKTFIKDAGTSNIWEVTKAINYNPDKYVAFLKDALKEYQAKKK
jgi:hypothetical protein